MKCAWSDQPRQAKELDEAPFDASPIQGEFGDENTRRVLSMLSHGGLFITGALPIIPFILLQASQDRVVKHNAKEAINLQISLLFYGVCLIGLMVLFRGSIPVVIFVLFLLSFLYPIVAIFHCLRKPDIPFTYLFILHLLK